MKKLLELLPILKLGTSTDNFPIYAQSLHITPEFLSTCNDDVSIRIKSHLDFSGDISFFVLNSILHKFQGNIDYEFLGETLFLSSEGFNTSLNVTDFGFPEIEGPTPDNFKITITDELESVIKLAINFIGSKGIFSYVYMGKGNIIAADSSRVFLFEDNDLIKDCEVLLNSRILPLAVEGVKVGSYSNNTVVQFENGYAIFVVHDSDDYPTDNAKNYIKNSTENITRICNIAVIKDALEKVQHILFGEKEQVIYLSNKNSRLKIVAESAMNGISTYNADSDSDESFSIDMPISYFRKIPLNFDLFVEKSNPRPDKIILSDNEKSTIMLMGDK